MLLFIFSSLIVITLAAALFLQRKQKEKLFNPSSPIKIEAAEKIKKISIQKSGEEEIVLAKENGNWLIKPKDYPADQNKIKNLLEQIDKINKAEIVSNNPERHRLFQVGEKASKLTLEYPEKTITFLIGKTSIQRQGTYIRKEDDVRVFLVPSYLNSSIDTKDWKDYSITDYLEGDIDKIAISTEEKEVSLEKKDEKWLYQEKELEKEEIEKLTNLLRALRA